MKRYIVFAGDNYYPRGGWKDKRGSFDQLDEAVNKAKEYYEEDRGYHWCHVVDLETGNTCWDHWELKK